MNELESLLAQAERLLERVRGDVESEEFDVSFGLIKDAVAALQDRAAASRIGDSMEGMRGSAYVLRTHPKDPNLRKFVVIPPIEKFVLAVKIEVHRTRPS